MKLLIFKTNPKQLIEFNSSNFVYRRIFQINGTKLSNFENNKLIIFQR